MTQYILAIDQGTTSTRAAIYLPGQLPGQGILAMRQLELTQYFPEPGWVEHDAEEIWQATLTVCRQVIADCKLSVNQIAAMGIANQRETVVMWERATGKPVARAIVWHDRRTADLCRRYLAEKIEPEVQAKTGLLLDPYFSATKIKWLLDTLPGIRKRAEAGELACGTIDSYLLFRLSAGKCHATDASNASRTLLFNLYSQTWDEDLLKLFHIPSCLLPDIQDSNANFTYTAKDIFGIEIPITGVIGDQQAALLGQACTEAGMLKATYGTGCFLLMHTGNKMVFSSHRMLTTVALRLNGQVSYALEGSSFAAGATVQWLRDALHIIKSSSETEQFAAGLPSTQGVYLVPAFAGLGAPYWDPLAKGAILGLTHNTGIAHIVRAALESIGYQTKDLLSCLELDAGIKIHQIRVDGGMTINTWLMQFLADIMGLPIVKPQFIESSVVGAALLAALGRGIYTNIEQIAAQWQAAQIFNAHMEQEQADNLYKGWQQAVKRVCHA
jgi:glycerol kinase